MGCDSEVAPNKRKLIMKTNILLSVVAGGDVASVFPCLLCLTGVFDFLLEEPEVDFLARGGFFEDEGLFLLLLVFSCAERCGVSSSESLSSRKDGVRIL